MDFPRGRPKKKIPHDKDNLRSNEITILLAIKHAIGDDAAPTTPYDVSRITRIPTSTIMTVVLGLETMGLVEITRTGPRRVDCTLWVE